MEIDLKDRYPLGSGLQTPRTSIILVYNQATIKAWDRGSYYNFGGQVQQMLLLVIKKGLRSFKFPKRLVGKDSSVHPLPPALNAIVVVSDNQAKMLKIVLIISFGK